MWASKEAQQKGGFMLAKSSWTMKSAILVVIITALVSCLVAGCGSDKEEKASWNGNYTGRTYDEDGSGDYTDVEVIVDDGYMTVKTVEHFDDDGEAKTSEREGEGKFEEGEDGKSIFIPIESDYYKAELRKLSGKYFLSIKDKDDDDVQEKYEVEKNAKNKPETSMTPVQTTTKVEETTTKKPKKVKKHKKKSASVSSDFKETLDDYEDFIDDYVVFMKKYKKASAAEQAGMLTDYSEMMSKYSELSSEMSNMKSNLSSDELAYYTKVMSRVAKKLSKVS